MTAPFARSRLHRWLAGLLSFLIALGPLATPAYAALTLLADEPLNVRNASKPNIVLTVDDSTSMLFDFLPDYVVNAYCRDGTGKMAAACGESGQANDFSAAGFGRFLSPGYIAQQWKIPYTNYVSGSNYDNSGPGAGCDLSGFPPRCSGGVDPTSAGSQPGGIERYPGTSPRSGMPYEYWKMWPAPVHNSAFNKLYYNPAITYDPPINADGTSFPQMDAGGTNNWTQVPTDPWAAAKVYVDLTASVTVGQWCNSDWTQGTNPVTNLPFVTDPAYCRTNGVVAAAANGAPAAIGDYMYPWVPPNIAVDRYTCPSGWVGPDGSVPPRCTLNGSSQFATPVPMWSNIAYSKVAGGTPTAAFLASEDPKYFYENDNVIWCNTKSALWPQGGVAQAQVCNGAQSQTCVGGTPQSCGGGTQQTCSSITQACQGAQGQICQTIVNNQTCTNVKSQTCNGSQAQNCNGAKNDQCNGNNPQICKGYAAQTCGAMQPQACNGVQNQTCTNMHSSNTGCTTAYNPPGCNTCVGPECPICTLQTSCPIVGNCSVQTGTACTKDADCATISGTCSATKGPCTSAAQCPSSGQCTATGIVCTANAQCPTIMGTCDQDQKQCTVNGDCAKYGYCNTGANVCFGNADCPTIPGACTVNLASCTSNAQCSTVPGKCTVTNAACTSNAQCPNVGGTCSATGAACTQNTDCGATGTCSVSGAICQLNSQCPTLPGQCNVTKTACVVGTDCAVVPGVCSISGVACTNANQCPNVNMKCSIDNNACGSNANCPVVGAKCSITASACIQNADCAIVAGACSITGAACTSSAQCSAVSTASSNATCSDLLSDYSKTLLADALSNGVVCRMNNRDYNNAAAGRFNYPDNTYNFPVTGGIGVETIWIDDALPAGAFPAGWYDNWTWVNNAPKPYSGTVADQSALQAGMHYHYYFGGPLFPVNSGDLLSQWVYLDPKNPPTEIQLWWYDQTGSWEHRAYWGSNVLLYGNDGTVSRRYMGPLPPTGQWVRLVVPAATVGLEGMSVNGILLMENDGRVTYDRIGKAASAVQGSGDPLNACMPTPRFTNVPHHYWKTSLEWCDKSIATAGDKWVGYGTPTGGSCQAFKDATHVYPRFYKYGAAAGADNTNQAAFERVDLDITKRGNQTFTHTFRDATNTVQTITRSWDEEMTNYANWFAYYRTRIQAVKTVTSLVFNDLDDTYRVGFHTLTNVPVTSFVNIQDFTPAQKTAWWSQLFGISIRLNVETPTLDAVERIGEYYKNGTNAELQGSTDPIILSCQKNWHMLFTDGFTNQPKVPAIQVGNTDKIVPALPQAVLGLTPGQPWPPLYRENAQNPSLNSASDYTTSYWVTDLRTVGAVSTDNVPTSDLDPASWQHQNFAAMSLGTEGKLPAGNQQVTEDQLKAGAIQWPQPYPSVNKPDESGVDDLWHAAINGRGRFVNAQSTDELRLGMGQILADITNQAGSRAGVGFQSVNLSASNKYVYRVRFEPGWGGSLTKVEIDPKTGNEVQEVWRAADQLTAQLLVVAGVKDTPWFTERKIVTTDTNGKHVPFLWNNLTAAQQNSLSPRVNKGMAIVEFLRGNRSNEGAKVGNFRVRPSPLGDIVDSQAVFVGPPKAPYIDGNDPSYSAFKAQFAGRDSRVYVAANDGMVHAFDDLTGNESWAYVPLGAYNLTNPLVTSRTLGALSYQDGGLPAFHHHFYVDSTPRIVDVDFGGGTGDWRSLMVGGMAKGGKSYYAIDVTDPAAFTSEAEVAKKVVWEFTDADMGYSYGKPLVTKTHAAKWNNGSGDKWLAILPSGYDNASGVGKLFFVDVASGALLLTMSTGSGDANNPSGLTHIAGYTKDYRNQMTEQIYAGDLNGDLWRFDVSDPNANNWTVAKIASLTDPNGVGQPVTTPPQIEVDVTNGTDRWVFVGTGKLYHQSDLANNQIQTMYAIRDGTNSAPNNFGGKVITRADLLVVKDATGLPVKPDNGWFDDLPAGQRIVVPPQAALSVVTYSATSPQTDPCLTGEPANVYAREFARGNSLMQDANGNAVETFYSAEGGVGLDLLALDTVTSSGIPNIVVGLTLGTTGKLKPITITPPNFFEAHRMSWRLLSE